MHMTYAHYICTKRDITHIIYAHNETWLTHVHMWLLSHVSAHEWVMSRYVHIWCASCLTTRHDSPMCLCDVTWGMSLFCHMSHVFMSHMHISFWHYICSCLVMCSCDMTWVMSLYVTYAQESHHTQTSSTHTHTHINIYIHIYSYMYIYVYSYMHKNPTTRRHRPHIHTHT